MDVANIAIYIAKRGVDGVRNSVRLGNSTAVLARGINPKRECVGSIDMSSTVSLLWIVLGSSSDEGAHLTESAGSPTQMAV